MANIQITQTPPASVNKDGVLVTRITIQINGNPVHFHKSTRGNITFVPDRPWREQHELFNKFRGCVEYLLTDILYHPEVIHLTVEPYSLLLEIKEKDLPKFLRSIHTRLNSWETDELVPLIRY